MGDKVMKVTCGANDAAFHVSRYTGGGRSKCVFFGRKWLSPVEFEEQGRMSNSVLLRMKLGFMTIHSVTSVA